MIVDNLQTRLDYMGGRIAENRMIQGKLETLEKALLYSYQAETIQLEDGREFRCLINPDKETGNYDNKIISIPYKSICLNEKPGANGTTTQAKQEVGLKCGDVFVWKETNTHWITFLEYLEENAYFRSQIRRCDQTTTINGKEYWIYIRGPVETSIRWNQKAKVEWNDMNHSLELYITKNQDTIDFFKRFKKIKIKEEVTGKEFTWQIVACNAYYGDGIIKASLDEFFENTIEEEVQKEKDDAKNNGNQTAAPLTPYIKGVTEIKPFDKTEYTAENFTGTGDWVVKYNGQVVQEQKNSKSIVLSVTKKKGKVTLEYNDGFDNATLDVDIIAF